MIARNSHHRSQPRSTTGLLPTHPAESRADADHLSGNSSGVSDSSQHRVDYGSEHVHVADAQATHRFLQMLWGDRLPDGGHVTIADKAAGFAARQFVDLVAASKYASDRPDRYLTMCAMAAIKSGRGRASDVTAIPCFWFDADCLTGRHAKSNLPGTIEEAVVLVQGEFDIPPSLIIESGGGIYAIWLLDEPWILHNSEERKLARAVSKGMQSRLKAIGETHGWEFDDTSDLSRCLRAPGTLNGKYTPPRLVSLRSAAEDEPPKRYLRVSLIEQFARSKSRKLKQTSTPMGPDVERLASFEGVLRLATDHLAGAEKIVEEDGRKTAAVLTTCPACKGLESDGATATGTAHLTGIRLQLRCKRESCAASGDGLSFESWTSRFLAPQARASLAAALAGARSHGSLRFTDASNADRFLQQHGQVVRCCPEAGGLLAFNGRTWESDAGDGLVMRMARDTARQIVAGAGSDVRHALRVESENGLRSMVALAKLDIYIPHETLDADPQLLNCANGTINLANGTLRPHRRTDLITKFAPTQYDEDARDPEIEAFLEHVSSGSSEYKAFLMRALGYLATGSTVEGAAFFLQGPSSTGKTTFVEETNAVLGDGYTTSIPFAALLRNDRDGESPRPFLVSSRGRRVVTAAEVNEGAVMDAAVLKSITGGDTIPLRDLHGRPFRMRPTFKLLLAANHMPRIEPKDEAVRRRVFLLPFRIPIEAGRLDLGFQRRIQQSERARSAWLALMVRGAVEWHQHGLGSSEVVEVATRAFWDGQAAAVEESIVLAAALSSAFEQTVGHFETTDRIVETLKNVLALDGERVPGGRRLGAALRRFGCEPSRTSAERGWVGIRKRVTE